jgi:cytochrome c556
MTALAQSQPADVGKGFMRAKLTHSQRILEGVTLKDFSAIARHAEQLKALSFDASWQVLRTEEYVRHGEEFRRAADRLTHAANGENLDAALLAYFRLTQNCVDCHEHVRDHRSP